MQHLIEKNAFCNQNLSFTQPPRHKGSADTLMNPLATVIYVKQKFYSLCNDFYREFTLHRARGWRYFHFRGENNIRCLADIFFPEGL